MTMSPDGPPRTTKGGRQRQSRGGGRGVEGKREGAGERKVCVRGGGGKTNVHRPMSILFAPCPSRIAQRTKVTQIKMGVQKSTIHACVASATAPVANPNPIERRLLRQRNMSTRDLQISRILALLAKVWVPFASPLGHSQICIELPTMYKLVWAGRCFLPGYLPGG